MTSTLITPQAPDGERAGERVWRTELSPVSFLRRAAVVHADAAASASATDHRLRR